MLCERPCFAKDDPPVPARERADLISAEELLCSPTSCVCTHVLRVYPGDAYTQAMPVLERVVLLPEPPLQMVYTTPTEVDFELTECLPCPSPSRVVLADPRYFNVEYVINPHMSGHIGTVDTARARQQWKALRAVYSALDVEPLVAEGQPGLPDMVFCANQTLPYFQPATEERGIVLSRMRAPERRPEVPHFEDFFHDLDYAVQSLPDGIDSDFEGMGDAIWHPGRYLLWGGFGFRTDRDTYAALADLLEVRVMALSLGDPEFYHLDTCFSVLDEESVLIYPGAFEDDAIGLIRRFFSTVIEAPEGEARHQFACNAHCPDGTHVLIQEGCTVTSQRLRDAGFRPIDLDTSEFLKSGGSVFCMKQMIW